MKEAAVREDSCFYLFRPRESWTLIYDGKQDYRRDHSRRDVGDGQRGYLLLHEGEV